MSLLIVFSLAGGYVLYVLWYSIANDYFDVVVLIICVITLIALVLWYESVVSCIA